MKSYIKCAFVALFLIGLGVFCKADQILELDHLVKEVIKNNPSLEATQDRIDAASLAADRARVPDDPAFVFRSMGNQSHQSKFMREVMRENRYEFIQKVRFPGKLKLEKEIKLQDLAFTKSVRIKTRNDLILQTKILYFDLYFNHASQQINLQNKTIVSKLINSATAQYKTGKGTQADVLKAQIEMQVLNDEIVALESEEKYIKAMINAIRNKPQRELLGKPRPNFYGPLTFDRKKTEETAMKNKPELRGQKALIVKEKKAARLARKNYFPDLYFEFMIQQKPGNERNAWGISLGFDIPVWIRQKQKREAEEAESKALANLLELQGMKNNVRANIEGLLATIEASDVQINLYNTAIIPKTKKTLKSNEANYKAGRGNFLDIIDTRRQLQQVELMFESIRTKKEIVLAKLENEIGVSIERIIENTAL